MKVNRLMISLLSVLLGFIVGAIILQLSNISPLEAYTVMFKGTFEKPQYIAYVIIRSTPLILTGLSVAFAFRTGLFNIGAEGQFIIGAMTATIVGLKLNLPIFIQIPLVIIIAMMVSGMYGGLAGFFKAKYGVHEVISTIMFNWIALYISNFLVMSDSLHRPDTETTEFINYNSSITLFENFKNSEEGIKWLESHPFLAEFLRPPVNAGIFLAIIAVIIIWFILNRTTFGFKLKSVGLNPDASRFAGINVNKKMTQSMFIAGSLSGLAGALHVMGVSKNVAILASHEGYGFDGIAVSLIGSNSPIGALVAGFFLGALKYSGQKIQSALEAPSEVISIMIGSIIFFIAIPKLIESALSFFKGKKS
jgi:simple sugar transport system permease protein